MVKWCTHPITNGTHRFKPTFLTLLYFYFNLWFTNLFLALPITHFFLLNTRSYPPNLVHPPHQLITLLKCTKILVYSNYTSKSKTFDYIIYYNHWRSNVVVKELWINLFKIKGNYKENIGEFLSPHAYNILI